MKQAMKALFVPKLVDNSPKGWCRLAGQTTVEALAVNVGVFGAMAIVGIIVLRWEEKVRAQAIEDYKQSLIKSEEI